MPSSAGGRGDAGAARGLSASGGLSPAEFAARFEASARALWCIAAAVLADRSRAQDVVQEAAVIALGKLATFDPATNFAAWMGQIVRFVALNEARRRATQRATSLDPAALDAAPADRPADRAPLPISSRGELLADQDVFDDRVSAALRTLDETARACLLLRTLLDMPYAEISRCLTIPEGTAMSHVHRSRQVMRTALAATGGTAGGRDSARRAT